MIKKFLEDFKVNVLIIIYKENTLEYKLVTY